MRCHVPPSPAAGPKEDPLPLCGSTEPQDGQRQAPPASRLAQPHLSPLLRAPLGRAPMPHQSRPSDRALMRAPHLLFHLFKSQQNHRGCLPAQSTALTLPHWPPHSKNRSPADTSSLSQGLTVGPSPSSCLPALACCPPPFPISICPPHIFHLGSPVFLIVGGCPSLRGTKGCWNSLYDFTCQPLLQGRHAQVTALVPVACAAGVIQSPPALPGRHKCRKQHKVSLGSSRAPCPSGRASTEESQ